MGLFCSKYDALKKRKLELAVISDVHLGTEGCHAHELLTYLNSIEPKRLVLNGDILDVWKLDNTYFPAVHSKVLNKLLTMASRGTEVYYITGNHDEKLRKFLGTAFGNFKVQEQLLLQLDGKRAWFFHGDIFDYNIQIAKWLLKLGRYHFKPVILFNKCSRWVLHQLGKKQVSLSQKIGTNEKGKPPSIRKFEDTGIGLAIENNIDFIVCGHTHQAKKEERNTRLGRCTYLNSGDWVTSLTALEYSFKRWRIYTYDSDKLQPFFADEELKEMNMDELISAVTTINNSKKEKESMK